MSEKNKNTLDIECPHCFEENKVNLSKEIKCKHCEKPLIGEKYRKPIITAFTAILLGSGLGVTADAYLNLNRASVETEYKMMRTCIKEVSNLYYTKDEVKDCVCVVKSMSGLLDAEQARLYGKDKLRDILLDRYQNCKN